MADFNLDEIDAELQRRGVDPNALEASSSINNRPNPTYGTTPMTQTVGAPGMDLGKNLRQGLTDVFVRDPLIGIANAAQGIFNAPYYLNNAVGGPDAANLVAQSGFAPSNIDYAKLLGEQHTGPLDQLVQGAAQFGPYALAAGPSVLGQMAGGSAYGLTQSQSPFTSAAVGGLMGAIPGLAGKVFNYGANAIAPSIIKEQLAPKILAGLNDVYSKKAGLLNSSIGDLTEDSAHEKAMQLAGDLGEEGKLDPSEFHAKIDAQIQELQNEKARSPFRAPEINKALRKLQGVQDSKLESYADAFQLAKDLNKEYGNRSLIDKPLPFQMLSNARGFLEGTIDDASAQAGPDVAAANQMRNIANALTEQRVRQQTFSGTHSDVDLGANPFVSKYSRLSQTDKDNLFSPEMQQQIESLKQAVMRQKFGAEPLIPGVPSLAGTIKSVAGKIGSHIPGGPAFARYQMANPQAIGQVPSLANYGLIPGLNNLMNPPGAQ